MTHICSSSHAGCLLVRARVPPSFPPSSSARPSLPPSSVRSAAASEAFPEAAAAALAAAYPKWALPFAFVAFPPRLRRLAVRTTYLCSGRGTLPIVKGDFLLQRLALQLRTELPTIILNTHVMHKGSRSAERLRSSASQALPQPRASTFARKNLRHRDCEIVF